jgi:peptidyl-prolyl cis-trans isomerase D
MLQVLRRKHVSRIIFWSLLVLILPAFVLWGTGSMSGPKRTGPKYVGIINNKKISFEDLSSSLASIRAQFILNYFNQPDTLNSILGAKPFLAKLAWDRIIILDEAKKNRIKVSNQEVIGAIKNHPIFTRGGVFDHKLYQYILAYNLGLSPRSFEEMARDNLAIQKFNEMLTKNITASEEDARSEFFRDNGKYKISYVFYGLNDKLDKASVTDEAVSEYFNKNQGRIAVTPKDGADKAATRPATFEEAKDDIKKMLLENEARKLAFADSIDSYKKLLEAMEKEKLSFEDAAAKLGLKTGQTDFMARTEIIEEAGDSPILTEALAIIKTGEVSKPIPSKNGIIVVKIVETDKIDEEKFAKAKDEYMKKALESKKNRYLENWLRGYEEKTTLNIDFNNYDQYFK